MVWIWVVLIVLILGAAVVIAVGRDDAMADVYDDRPDVSLPAGRSLTSDDLDNVRFSTGVRGYRMDEVDAFVARVTADLIAREQRAAEEAERTEAEAATDPTARAEPEAAEPPPRETPEGPAHRADTGR